MKDPKDFTPTRQVAFVKPYVCTPRVQIEEATSTISPAPGISVYQALNDAQLAGYRKIEVDVEKNSAVITWFKRES